MQERLTGPPLAACPWLENLRCPFASAQCEHPKSQNCVLIQAFSGSQPRRTAPGRASAREADGDGVRPTSQRLSPRESEVADLAERGLRTKEIAQQLNISPNTARNHLKAIFRKLNVRSQVELMAAKRR